MATPLASLSDTPPSSPSFRPRLTPQEPPRTPPNAHRVAMDHLQSPSASSKVTSPSSLKRRLINAADIGEKEKEKSNYTPHTPTPHTPPPHLRTISSEALRSLLSASTKTSSDDSGDYTDDATPSVSLAKRPRSYATAGSAEDIEIQGPRNIPQRYSLLPNHYKPFSAIADDFNQNAVLLQRTSPLTITNNGKNYLLIPKLNNGGAHCLVADFHPLGPSPISVLPVNKVLLKTFLDYSILIKRNSNPEAAIGRGASQNVLAQYDQVKKAGLPVMEIYNYDDALDGCGYFLVENVPHEFVVPWVSGTKFTDLTPDQRRVFDELHKFFVIGYKNGINLDLQPGNLRRRASNELVLTDLREDRPDEDDYESELTMNYVKMAKSFNSKNESDNYGPNDIATHLLDETGLQLNYPS